MCCVASMNENDLSDLDDSQMAFGSDPERKISSNKQLDSQDFSM